MAEGLIKASERVTFGIRTGSNGQMVAWGKRRSGEEVYDVTVQLRGGKALGVLRVFVMNDQPHIDMGELDKAFLPEVTEYIAEGLRLPFPALHGRENGATIVEVHRGKGQERLAAELARLALSALEMYGDERDTDDDREAYVRGIVTQAEKMIPGLADVVRAKLREDHVVTTSETFAWLAKGAGLVEEGKPKGKKRGPGRKA